MNFDLQFHIYSGASMGKALLEIQGDINISQQ